MALDKKQFSSYIKQFNFRELFNDMGWNNDKTKQPIVVDNLTFSLEAVGEKSGFKILLCHPHADGLIPDYATRKKIETKVTKLFQEHLIIFFDTKKTEQVWQLVVRLSGKPTKVTETRWHIAQDPELLFQRAAGIFFELDEEEHITIVDVKNRVGENFHQNNEKVTKKFYVEFKKEHSSFLKFIKGISEKTDQEWYASLMLNRLMFCYFIQKKGFLDKNKNYLRDKLKACKAKKGEVKFYSFYRDFLLVLFHKGLNEPEQNQNVKIEIGKIPYLNGGLFDEHELEKSNQSIDIDDKAFEGLFDFFDQYEWHLDTSKAATGKDINPDVIGYIFEKYINDRANMGAYYTKEDITDYISKNCILPFLFDETKRHYAKAFNPDGELWKMVAHSGDDYIYDAVKKGVALPLPEEIELGVAVNEPNLIDRRKEWNKSTPSEYALPTEIWREVVDRRSRYTEVKNKIENGEISAVNDFITYNLNIRQFAQDAIANTNDPDFLRYFYKALTSVTIIDPTCGSGAFLFAAMNILEPLYESCLQRMENFVAEASKGKYKYFEEVLAQVKAPEHPNLQYFIYKSIILHNLYGVDIMKEAVEIAKLRLFLKLVATVEADYRKPNLGLEPLPDIDFNIRAGNTLVGFATDAELQKGLNYTLDGVIAKPKIEEKCDIVAKAYKRYKEIQLSYGDDYKGFKNAKEDLNTRLKELNHELNQLLHKQASAYKYDAWLLSHQPFHWFAEFYEIVQEKGGFDVIIGNPPYIQNSNIKYSLEVYSTQVCGNLYATVLERVISLSSKAGYRGFIVPVSSISTDGYASLQKLFLGNDLFFSSFDDRPSKLFDGLEHIRLTIHIILPTKSGGYYSSKYNKWNSSERDTLFQVINYSESTLKILPNSFAKICSTKENSILRKMKTKTEPLLIDQEKLGRHSIFFSRKVGYFLQILDFEPLVLNSKGDRRPPSEFKEIRFTSKVNSDCALCTLNSNLFYWFITVFSDCRHLNKREIDYLPISLNSLTHSSGRQLSDLVLGLMEDLNNTSENKVMKFKHDTLTIQCIYPKYSKSIIDEIDTVLAKHYGFTEEELDFIINYDIKYRMGKELEGEED